MKFAISMCLAGLASALSIDAEIIATSTLAQVKDSSEGPGSLRNPLTCEVTESCDINQEEYCEKIRVDVLDEDGVETGEKVEEDWCRIDIRTCDSLEDICRISRCELDDSLCWIQQCNEKGYCTSAWSVYKCDESGSCYTEMCAGDSWCKKSMCSEDGSDCSTETVLCDLNGQCTIETCNSNGECQEEPTDRVLLPFNPKNL